MEDVRRTCRTEDSKTMPPGRARPRTSPPSDPKIKFSPRVRWKEWEEHDVHGRLHRQPVNGLGMYHGGSTPPPQSRSANHPQPIRKVLFHHGSTLRLGYVNKLCLGQLLVRAAKIWPILNYMSQQPHAILTLKLLGYTLISKHKYRWDGFMRWSIYVSLDLTFRS